MKAPLKPVLGVSVANRKRTSKQLVLNARICAKAEEAAKKIGVSRIDFIREAIREFLDRPLEEKVDLALIDILEGDKIRIPIDVSLGEKELMQEIIDTAKSNPETEFIKVSETGIIRMAIIEKIKLVLGARFMDAY